MSEVESLSGILLSSSYEDRTTTKPAAAGRAGGRASTIVWTVIVLCAVELGWWWLQRLQHLQYRRDHPNTVFLIPHRFRPTRWGRATWVVLRLSWTLVVVATFGGCVALDVVLFRGVGTALRFVASCTHSLWKALRARLTAWKTAGGADPTSNDGSSTKMTASSTFVLAPILRSKTTASSTFAAGPSSRSFSHQRYPLEVNKGAKRGVTFDEHSNGHIRHKQISFDPASATAFSVEESRTPPPGQSAAPTQQQSKARMAQTPPLPRRGQTLRNEENHQEPPELLRGSERVDSPSSAAPATPQKSQSPENISSSKFSRPVIPPNPLPSAMLAETLRKRRASSSSNEYSPAVKRMYGRLRLPPQSLSQVSYQYQPHVVARKMKRRRENDLILLKAFNTVPSASKKAAVQAGVPASNVSGEANPSSQSSTTSTFPFAFNTGAAVNSTSENPPPANPQPGLFQFGSSAVTTTPTASTEAASTVTDALTGGPTAPESSTAGVFSATASGIRFGFSNPNATEAAVQGGGTELSTSSGGATSNPGEVAASPFLSQLGSSSLKPDVNATPDATGPPLPLGLVETTGDNSSTPLTLHPGGAFQPAFTNGASNATDGNTARTSEAQRLDFGTAPAPQATFTPTSNLPAAPTANPSATTLQSALPAANPASTPSFQFGSGNPQQIGSATTLQPSLPAANPASTPLFQFGSGNPQQNVSETNPVPPHGFGISTPDPAAQTLSTPAASTLFTFGAGPEQTLGMGGGITPAPTFQFGTNSFGAQGLGSGMNGAATGGFASQPASSVATSTVPFSFGQTAAQPMGVAIPFSSSVSSGSTAARSRGSRKPSRGRGPRR